MILMELQCDGKLVSVSSYMHPLTVQFDAVSYDSGVCYLPPNHTLLRLCHVVIGIAFIWSVWELFLSLSNWKPMTKLSRLNPVSSSGSEHRNKVFMIGRLPVFSIESSTCVQLMAKPTNEQLNFDTQLANLRLASSYTTYRSSADCAQSPVVMMNS